MPYCPSCGSEYEASVARCTDCGVALTSEPPMTPERDREAQAHSAVAYIADNETDATIISDLLTDAGIQNSTFKDPMDMQNENLRVEVLEDDLAAAKRLIAEFKSEGPTPDELEELTEEAETDESDDDA